MEKLKDKFYKNEKLKENPELSQYIPETYTYSEEDLRKMLTKYMEIIIKPKHGAKGIGITKISKVREDEYKVQIKDHKFIINGIDSLCQYFEEKLQEKKHSYIVQYCIPLAKVDGKIFDIRYIVQRKRSSNEWVVTAMQAKRALVDRFVTNLKMGGRHYTVEQAFEGSGIENVEEVKRNIERVLLLASEWLGEEFKGHRIWGFDIGVDEFGAIFIIEVNSHPGLKSFRWRNYRHMYRVIQEYR
ncbi:YheC/YheD family protein [Cytobacillus sp. FJAT-54145]|uniref:YheC/YheD family protein n=1 Tax=Cytobacillus spartinae TaxID=3299023 RepID=A0ABW6K8U2_9BACI